MTILFIIVGLACLDSLNPSAILMAFAILGISKNHRKLTNLISYSIGMMLTELLIGIIAVFGFFYIIKRFLYYDVQNVSSKVNQIWNSSIPWWLLLGLSVIIIIILLKFPENKIDIKLIDKLYKSQISKRYYFVILGIVMTFVEFSTAMPYLGAITLLVALKQSFLLKIFYLILYAIIYILPQILIIMLYLFKSNMINTLSQKYLKKLFNIVPMLAGSIFKISLVIFAVVSFIFAVWHLV